MSYTKPTGDNGHACAADDGVMEASDGVGEEHCITKLYRNSQRVVRTVIVCMSFTCTGLCFGIWNGTLVDLEKMMHTNTQLISTIFTCRGVGSIFSMVALSILIDKLNAMLVVGCCLVLTAVITIALPWSGSLPALLFLGTLKGSSLGLAMIGCQAVVFKTWATKAAPVINGLWLAFITGMMLAPLIARPFLSSDSKDVAANTSSIAHVAAPGGASTHAQNAANFSIIYQSGANETTNVVVEEITTVAWETRIHYAFLIVGILTALAGLSSILYFCCDSCQLRNTHKRTVQVAKTEDSLKFKIPLLLLFLFFNMLAVGADLTYVGLLMTFVVKYLGWTKPTATGLVTIYSASQVVGRFIAIFTSRVLTPNKILVINFILGSLSMGILLFAIDKHFVVLWICTCGVGYATSTLYTCAVTWMNNMIVITGRILGIFTLGVPVGYMTIPLLTGTLMTKLDLKWFLYVCFACWIGNILIHVAISFFVYRYDKYKSHHNVARSIKDLESWHDRLREENAAVKG